MTRRDEIARAVRTAAGRIMEIPFDAGLSGLGGILGPLSEWAKGKHGDLSWASYHWIWRAYSTLDVLSGEALDLAVSGGWSRAHLALAAELQALRTAVGLDQHSPRSGRAQLEAETLGVS